MNMRTFLLKFCIAAAALVSGLAGCTTKDLFSVLPSGLRPELSGQSSTAQEIFNRLYAKCKGGTQKGSIVHAVDGCFLIKPGEIVEFTVKGYCMDPSLPAPKNDEPQSLRPMEDYIPQPLMELFSKTMKTAGKRGTVNADVQKMVWAFRTVSSQKSWADGLSNNEYQLMNDAMPGGAQTFKQQRLSSRVVSEVVDYFKKKMAAVLPEFTPSDLSASSNAHLARLLNMPVNDTMPSVDYQYSMPAPGIAARSVGQGGLSSYVSIANDSDQTFCFDPTRWALESPRKVQRVAMLPPKNGKRVCR